MITVIDWRQHDKQQHQHVGVFLFARKDWCEREWVGGLRTILDVLITVARVEDGHLSG